MSGWMPCIGRFGEEGDCGMIFMRCVCVALQVALLVATFIYLGNVECPGVPGAALGGLITSAACLCLEALYYAMWADVYSASHSRPSCMRMLFAIVFYAGRLLPWMSLGVWIAAMEFPLRGACFQASRFHNDAPMIVGLIAFYCVINALFGLLNMQVE
jgi:hypothetical protein